MTGASTRELLTACRPVRANLSGNLLALAVPAWAAQAYYYEDYTNLLGSMEIVNVKTYTSLRDRPTSYANKIARVPVGAVVTNCYYYDDKYTYCEYGGYAGYTPEERPHDTEQFDVSDQRTLDEVIRWLMEQDHIPSFCTACYRLGRTGDRFMSLCKTGQILNCCHPNALMTLTEYLEDYASPATKAIGYEMVERELQRIPKEKVREIAKDHIEAIKSSNRRDFRF